MKRAGQLVIVPPTDLAQQYANRINRAMGTAVAAVIEMGRAFHEAKAQLHHGGWLRMFADHPERIAQPVWCSKRTAQHLMAIAAHPVLAKAQNSALLPPTWTTLYELTKVEHPRLIQALEMGEIKPDMKGRDARRLRGVGSPHVPPRRDDDVLLDLWSLIRQKVTPLESTERARVLRGLHHVVDSLQKEFREEEPNGPPA